MERRWNNHKISKNKNQLIVDEFSDGAFQAYTVRLEEASQKGKIYIIDAEFLLMVVIMWSISI